MQKPSVGFDWLARLSGEGGDFGVIGVQARLAYNHEPDREVQLQIYNAWFKYKAGFADFWIGHDRPALGLCSYFDSHALLLPTLAMMGWGYRPGLGRRIQRRLLVGQTRRAPARSAPACRSISRGITSSPRGSPTASSSEDNRNLGLSARHGATFSRRWATS